MPAGFLLVADFGAVAAALLCTLLAIALVYLLKGLAAAIGKIGIGPFTLNLGGVVSGALDDAADWIVSNTKSLWVHVATLLYATAYIFDHLFNAAVNAIAQVFDYADHIVTSTIPNETNAIHTWVLNTVQQDFTNIAADIYNDAGQIGTAVNKVANDVKTDAENYTDSSVATLKKALTTSISNLTTTVSDDYTSAKNYAESQAASALATAKTLIGEAKTAAEDVAKADANAVQTTLQKAIDATNTTVNDLTQTVSNDYTAAKNFATTQVASGLADVTDILNGTANAVGGAIAAAAAGVAGGISGAVTDAQNDANTALDSADEALGDALAAVTSDVTGQAIAFGGDITSVEGQLAGAINGVAATAAAELGQAITDVANDIAGVERTFTGDIDTATGGLAAAILAAIGAVATRVTKLEECSVGVCDDSPNNFTSLLNDALGLASVVGVGAFLAQIINSPAQAEADYAGLIQGAYSTGQDLFQELLSL